MSVNSNKSIIEKTTVVNLSSPKAMAQFSKELKKFIVSNDLYTNIKGKNYVHVEGWQFAGASMGIFPIVEKLEDLTGDSGIYKYRSEVVLQRLSDGHIVGRGVATCSKSESKKSSFDEYAIASMAQTRAVGKAFRLTIGWVMKLAGYETTPKEEIDNIIIEAEEIDDGPTIPIGEVRAFIDEYIVKLSPSDKIRFLKQVGKLSDKNLDDSDYMRLYAIQQRGSNE